MSEKEAYQSDYPNSHYLANLNNLNKTNQSIHLNRLPTLGEILANKTKSPVDLFTFYQFMKDVENRVDYLDFWFDLINHFNLCKHYIRGLRESIQRQSQQLTDANRQSAPDSDKSKHRSLSSSILLDLIVNDNILEDSDSNRLSQFLRGDISMENIDPKLKDLIEHYNSEEQQEKRHSEGRNSSIVNKYMSTATSKYNSNVNAEYNPSKYVPSYQYIQNTPAASSQYISNVSATPAANFPAESPRIPSGGKRISSSERLLDDVEDEKSNNPFQTPAPLTKRQSTISPSLLEKLIRDSPGSRTSFITRENLKESSHSLLLKYFVEDSEKNLNLPHELHADIIKAIEEDGRDDPDVFNTVKAYVFNRIENEHLPKFLNFMAIRNVNHSNMVRIVAGFFLLLVAFWVSFILVFLDYKKSTRAVVVVPFFFAFYFLVSSIYLIDPVLVWIGFSEAFSRDKATNRRSLIRIRERFIHRLLVKRSIWVLFLVLVCTAILSVVFALVPGHRL